MITAIDTNILLDILVPNAEFDEASANALQDAADEGSLVISDIVYAELCIHLRPNARAISFSGVMKPRCRRLIATLIFSPAVFGGPIGNKAGSGRGFLQIFLSVLMLRRRLHACSREIGAFTVSFFRR